MMKYFNFLFIGVLCVASFFLFKSAPTPLGHMSEGVRDLNRQPAMIPGVEAVRPLAASQNQRADEIMSELALPPPRDMALPRPQGNLGLPAGFSGVVKNLKNDPTVNEFSVYDDGEKKLTRTEFYDVDTGVLLVKSLERFHENRLKRKVDEIYNSEGQLIKKYSTVFDDEGRISRKEVDLDLDGRPDQSLEF